MIFFEIEQSLKSSKLKDLKHTIWNEMKRNSRINDLHTGAEVAITAGSRGIDNIVNILKETVLYLQSKKLRPFIVPSMGSHGGATAEGQVRVLEHLGITEKSVGAPIRSSMEVVKVGEIHDDFPIYMDKLAYQADAIIVINRIKPHTAFSGKIESGLSKMVLVGLGKQKGASYFHSQGADRMEYNLVEGSKVAIENSPISMGLAIVEDSYDQTAIIQGVSIDHWHEEEAKLLKKAKELMPSLPVKDIDLLIVEEMGKNFSGTGMDPNIIGRLRIDGIEEPIEPRIKRIVVLDLSSASHGNAQGVGLADFTTEKLFYKVDREATYMNCITSTFLRRAMFPFIYPSEQDAIEQALHSLGPNFKRDNASIIQIANTLHVNRLIVSESALKCIPTHVPYTVTREMEWSFERGELSYKLSN